MGACMQTAVADSRMHPSLGCLSEVREGRTSFFQLSFPVASEEEYITWSKNIHKLRYSLDVKHYLYLPETQRFSQSDGLCQGSNRVELIFPPFYESLKQALIKNINNRRFFQESYLWYLIYVLVRVIKYYQKRQKPISSLSFDNLLIFNDGAIRIIPEDIIPHQDLTTLYNELEFQEESFQRRRSQESLSEVYIAGAICLSVADLMHPALCFDKNSRWSSVGETNRAEALKNCEKRYSTLLVETLAELTEKAKDQRVKINSLCKRLELFESQILARKELGLGLNLGYSSVESIRTSYCMDNKTALSNNSNILRLSSVGNESTSPSNRSVRQKEVEEALDEEEDDYLNIL